MIKPQRVQFDNGDIVCCSRLPTYTCTKRGILPNQDQSREIDVEKNLGLPEKKTLLERLDYENLLLKIKDTMDR